MTFRSRSLDVSARRMIRHWHSATGSYPPRRKFLTTCHLGCLNVTSLRSSFDIDAAGLLVSEGDEYLDVLKGHMQRYKLYALALSEIRLFGSGSVSVGDDISLSSMQEAQGMVPLGE